METLNFLIIEATTRSEVDEKLNASIRQLQDLAREAPSQGILVTQHGPGRYSARLSEKVPYGETWETVQFASPDAEDALSCQGS